VPWHPPPGLRRGRSFTSTRERNRTTQPRPHSQQDQRSVRIGEPRKALRFRTTSHRFRRRGADRNAPFRGESVSRWGPRHCQGRPPTEIYGAAPRGAYSSAGRFGARGHRHSPGLTIASVRLRRGSTTNEPGRGSHASMKAGSPAPLKLRKQIVTAWGTRPIH
jgi:hypothetical protein